MILYGSSFSPFVRKVIAFAAERGAPLEVRPVVLGDADPGFRAASPLGKMPALVDGDFALWDSTAIVTYLDGVTPGAPLIPAPPRDRARTCFWDEFADTELFGVARAIFFNRVVLPIFQRRPDQADHAAADAAEAALAAPLAYLEGLVPDPGGWLVGGALSLADIAVANLFVNLDHCTTAHDPAVFPRTHAWVRPILARPSFAETVAGEAALLAKLRAKAAA